MSFYIPIGQLKKADNSSPRKCKKCGVKKVIELFSKQQLNRRSHTCKECTNKRSIERRKQNMEKQRMIDYMLMSGGIK